MNLASATVAARPPLVTATVEKLPKGLPKVDAIPAGSNDHDVPDHWFDWNLATITQQQGYDPNTGKPVFDRTRVVHAPYFDFKDGLKLDKSTPWETVVATARARTDYRIDNAIGSPQAILQAKDGAWFITTAGYWEGPDHIEPINLDMFTKDATVRQGIRELKAIVDQKVWVDFTTP